MTETNWALLKKWNIIVVNDKLYFCGQTPETLTNVNFFQTSIRRPLTTETLEEFASANWDLNQIEKSSECWVLSVECHPPLPSRPSYPWQDRKQAVRAAVCVQSLAILLKGERGPCPLVLPKLSEKILELWKRFSKCRPKWGRGRLCSAGILAIRKAESRSAAAYQSCVGCWLGGEIKFVIFSRQDSRHTPWFSDGVAKNKLNCQGSDWRRLATYLDPGTGSRSDM